MSTHPESPFRHAICAPCFAARNPGREPVRILPPDDEQCCYCGAPTRDGIYIRDGAQPYCGIEVK
jgi:hypothetical protein